MINYGIALPKGVMTSDIKQELVERKTEILTFLKQAKDVMGDKRLVADVILQTNVMSISQGECQKPGKEKNSSKS